MASLLSSSALDLLAEVRIGQAFTVNGREYTRASYSVDGFADARGRECMNVVVWTGKGGTKRVRVAENDVVEALPFDEYAAL